jgi:DNA-binding transcriptional LysR family regulator
VSCPVALAHAFLPDVISRFLEQYPLVQLDMVLLNRRVDLISEGIDVALRVRDLGDEDPALVTRRLRQAQMQLVAAPGFADHIREPAELASLPVLGAAEADRLVHLLGPHGKQQEIALEPRLDR